MSLIKHQILCCRKRLWSKWYQWLQGLTSNTRPLWANWLGKNVQNFSKFLKNYSMGKTLLDHSDVQSADEISGKWNFMLRISLYLNKSSKNYRWLKGNKAQAKNNLDMMCYLSKKKTTRSLSNDREKGVSNWWRMFWSHIWK